MNIRKSLPYKLLKKLLWMFWKPYGAFIPMCDAAYAVYKEYLLYWYDSAWDVRAIGRPLEDGFYTKEDAHKWAFENLSITGKELKYGMDKLSFFDEFRLLGYIIRHTVGFRKDIVRLTDDELENGRRRLDGSRYDNGCGVSRNTLKEARDGLIQKDMIEVDGKYYSAKLDNGQEEGLSETDTSGYQKLTPMVSETDTPHYIRERQYEKQSKDICSPTASEIARHFTKWYETYPKKKQPKDAERAYAKAIKAGATYDELQEGAAVVATELKRGLIDKQFIPYPASWLNAGSWKDENKLPASLKPWREIYDEERRWAAEKKQLCKVPDMVKQPVGSIACSLSASKANTPKEYIKAVEGLLNEITAAHHAIVNGLGEDATIEAADGSYSVIKVSFVPSLKIRIGIKGLQKRWDEIWSNPLAAHLKPREITREWKNEIANHREDDKQISA